MASPPIVWYCLGVRSPWMDVVTSAFLTSAASTLILQQAPCQHQDHSTQPTEDTWADLDNSTHWIPRHVNSILRRGLFCTKTTTSQSLEWHDVERHQTSTNYHQSRSQSTWCV